MEMAGARPATCSEPFSGGTETDREEISNSEELNLKKLVNLRLSLSDGSTSSEHQSVTPLPVSAPVKPTSGIRKGSVSQLRDYIHNIISNQRGGILLETVQFSPFVDGQGTSHYREGHEYKIQLNLKAKKVHLCHDMQTGLQFVRKKLPKQQHLYGPEFMLKEAVASHPQFQKVWGASKDECACYLYYEYCQGCTPHFRSPWHNELIQKAEQTGGFHNDLVLVDLWAIGEHWKEVVPIHLHHILKSNTDDDARVLLRLLQYFSQCFIDDGIEKSAHRALQIVSDRVEDALPPAQPQEDADLGPVV
ncbi:hypothetical protein BaRGS_00007584 [Batillaria attramentaria]|uniref:Uncharacterized protein n=1 Tax=Batillaria attramentaria TaxID=370345 RepID=A0ABD0LQ16_9CAEN